MAFLGKMDSEEGLKVFLMEYILPLLLSYFPSPSESLFPLALGVLNRRSLTVQERTLTVFFAISRTRNEFHIPTDLSIFL